MKLRAKKEKNKFTIQQRQFFIWRDLYDSYRLEYISFSSEKSALKFISRYASYKEDKTIITIDSELLKEKFPQHYV